LPTRLGPLIAIGLALAWLLLGCSSIGSDASNRGVARIQRTGELRVGMTGGYPPMNARTIDGRLIGLDADLAAALASILKVRLVLVERPLGELLESVRSGEVDVAISGLTMTPRRNLKVAFAGPYYLARKGLLARPELLEGVENVADLAGLGLRVAAVAGGTSEELVRRRLPDSTHLFVANQDDAVALIVTGEADVLVADDPVIRFALLRHPDSGLAWVESTPSAEPIGIAVSPGDPLFLNLIENYLRNLEEIGLLDKLRTKWFESDDWIGYLE
jgi:polar amino acid transport system substrate-binding protein